MTEAQLLQTARVRWLTRGPPQTAAPCDPARGMSCARDPQRCPCEPGTRCKPGGKGTDRRGCVVARAPRNAKVIANHAVCAAGHTWDGAGLDCVPIPNCGSGVDYAGTCFCPAGSARSATGSCEPAQDRDSAASEAAAASQPTSAPVVQQDALSVGPVTYPRWVWRAVAAGVALAVLLTLYLLGSIFSGLRSRRFRSGLKRYCIRCGRKMELEDSSCPRCKARQP